ncbi:MAG: hypothetical protein AAFM92_03265 [Pseudomonadota bacterium]
MPAPTLTLPLTGTDPKVARIEDLQTNVDAGFSALFDDIVAAASEAGVAELTNYGGTANAITADTTVGDVTVGAGFKVSLRAQATNTAVDPTLAVNGGTAYPIRENGDTELPVGALSSNRFYVLRLTGSEPNLRWEAVSTGLTLSDALNVATVQDIANALTVGGVINLTNYGGTAQATTADTNVIGGEAVTIQSGLKIKYRPPETNTATDPTLTIDGGDTFPIRDNGDSALAAGDLVAGRLYDLRLTGASPNQRWEVSNTGLTIAEVRASGFLEFAQTDRATFIATEFPATVLAASFFSNGIEQRVVRDAAGTAITSNGGTVNWSPAPGTVNPLTFGDNTTPGTTNMTAAVRAAHVFANATGRPVSYIGMGDMLIDLDAKILVSTSTDMAGTTIKVANGITDPATHDGDIANDTWCFEIMDAATPVTETTYVGSITDGARGSRAVMRDSVTTPGFIVAFFDGVDVPKRNNTTLEEYKQPFWLTDDGYATHGVARDVSAATGYTYRYRPNPASGWLEFKNCVIDYSTFNNTSIIMVRRNLVHVRDIYGIEDGTVENLNRIIHVSTAGQVHLSDVFVPAQGDDLDNTSGSYSLRLFECAEIFINRMIALREVAWGCMSGNEVSGVYFNDCQINRVDFHGAGFNFFVKGGSIRTYGIRMGWGGGQISAEGVTFIDCDPFSRRPDFSGFIYGDLHMKDCVIQNKSFVTTLFDFTTDGGTGSTLMAGPLCYSITAENITRTVIDEGSSRDIRLMDVTIKAGTEVYMPSSIVFDGIRSSGTCRVSAFIDHGNMNIDTAIMSGKPVIRLANIEATQPATSNDSGIWIKPNTIVGSGEKFDMLIENVSFLVFRDETDLCAPTILNCREMAHVQGTANEPMYISGGSLGSPSGLGGVITGGGSPNNRNFLSLYNTSVLESGWDLSNVQYAIGVHIPGNFTTTIPATATVETMFTGFRAP